MFHWNGNDAVSTSAAASIAAPPIAGATMALSAFQCEWRYRAEARLSSLLRLKRGWDGHNGLPGDRATLEFAASVLAKLMLPQMPMPSIMPLSYGGVQIEWHRNGWDVEIEIASPNVIHMYKNEIQSGQETELDIGPDLSQLINEIDVVRS